MMVSVNDETVEVTERTTVAALLEGLGFPEKGIAVAVDWTVLPRSEWKTAQVTDGARLIMGNRRRRESERARGSARRVGH